MAIPGKSGVGVGIGGVGPIGPEGPPGTDGAAGPAGAIGPGGPAGAEGPINPEGLEASDLLSPYVVSGLIPWVSGVLPSVEISPGIAHNTMRLETTTPTTLVTSNTGIAHIEYVSINTSGALIITTAIRAADELAVADISVDAVGIATSVTDVRQLKLHLKTDGLERVTVDKDGNVDFSGNSLVAGTSYLEDTTKKALSSSVIAQIVYVHAVVGSDTTGDGSAAAPFESIQKAVDVLPRVITLDTVIAIGKGSYVESVNTAGLNVLASLTFKAMDTADRDLYDSGIATGGSSTKLIHTGKAWETNIFMDGKIWIWWGTGAGEIRDIIGNTADTVTISGTWPVPDTTTRYVITSPVVMNKAVPNAFLFQGLVNMNIYGLQFHNYTGNTVQLTAKSSAVINFNYFNSFAGVASMGHSDVGLRVMDDRNFYNVRSFGIHLEVGGGYILRRSVFRAATAGIGTGLRVMRGSFAATHFNRFQDLHLGISILTGSQVSNAAGQTFINNTTDIQNVDMEIRAINMAGGNLGIQTTNPTNILTFPVGSATDPIADSWVVHSLQSGKTILPILDSPLSTLSTTPIRQWQRKLIKPLLTDMREEKDEEGVIIKSKQERYEDKIIEYNHKRTLPKFTRKNYGLVAEAAPGFIQAHDDDGNLRGIDLGAYVGWLHACIKDLSGKVARLETGAERRKSRRVRK